MKVPQLLLNTGTPIPAIGIGCWMGRVGEGEHVTQMVREALELGYRHIDTAANYGDEESVGKALRESTIARSNIFLTTKLASEDHGDVTSALDRSLAKLGVEYVDLYLMHWPQTLLSSGEALQPDESPTYVETWLAMERLLSSGKVKAIGVSNFSIKTLSTLLAYARVVPAVNQIEAHPCLPQHELLKYCQERGIMVTAYSPVGKGRFLGSQEVATIASQRQVTGAQLLLSWGVQRGTVVIPKSEKRERLIENITVFGLSSEEMEILDNIHKRPDMHRSMCGFHSEKMGGSCFGWTYEQLGWPMKEGGVVS